jgi:hypothetical protein
MIPDGVAIILGGQEHPYPSASASLSTFSISPESKSQGRCWY